MSILIEKVKHSSLATADLASLTDNSLMYYSPQYLSFLSKVLVDTEIVCLTARQDGKLLGFLPVAIASNKKLGTVVNSLPFFGSHGGPMVRDGKSNPDVELAMMLAFSALVEDCDAISTTLIENPFHPISETLLSAAKLQTVDDRIGQYTVLPNASKNVEKSLFANYHVKTRNAVRKGQKTGQKVSQRTDVEALEWVQRIHADSILAMGGVPKPLKIFHSLIGAFGEKARLYVGEIDHCPVSGLFVLLHGDTVEYFTPVVAPAHKKTQVLSALIFEVMTKLSQEGFRRWNWGGTWRSQSGVYRFKSRWGTQDYPYRYFNRLRSDKIKAHSRASLNQAFPFFYLFKY